MKARRTTARATGVGGRRRWMKVAHYDIETIPGRRALSSEWRECARWVVLFGVEFAQGFDLDLGALETLDAA